MHAKKSFAVAEKKTSLKHMIRCQLSIYVSTTHVHDSLNKFRAITDRGLFKKLFIYKHNLHIVRFQKMYNCLVDRLRRK